MTDLLATFEWTTALMVFVVYLILDMTFAKYTLAVTKGQALRASFTGAFIYVFSAVGVLNYTENSLYIVPMALGAFIGTYIVVSRDSKDKEGVT